MHFGFLQSHISMQTLLLPCNELDPGKSLEKGHFIDEREESGENVFCTEKSLFNVESVLSGENK